MIFFLNFYYIMQATGRILDGKSTNIAIIPSFHLWKYVDKKNRQQKFHLERQSKL